MWAGLTRMGLAQGTFLPQPKMQELAEREGAKAFVVGSIGRVGGNYQITARVIATNGGSEALTALATADDSTELISAVEQVGPSSARDRRVVAVLSARQARAGHHGVVACVRADTAPCAPRRRGSDLARSPCTKRRSRSTAHLPRRGEDCT